MTLAGLNFRDLEYVAAVAEHLHFGRAAQVCAVSQPTLSAQIRKLEEYLGVEIFERGNRSVMVTERGALLVEQAKIILREGWRLCEIVQASAAPMTGSLDLGVIATLAPYILPLMLQPVRERFPQLDLRITDGLTANLVRSLENGDLDAIIASSPIRDADFSELPLFREQFILAVPRDHRLALAPQVTIEDLEAGELILLNEGHCLRDQVLTLCPDRQKSSRSGPGVQATSLEVLRQMIGAGMGCSLLPQLSVQVGTLLDDMVAYRVIRGAVTPGRDISLYYRTSFGRIRDVRLLRDLICDVMVAAKTVEVRNRAAAQLGAA